MEKDPIQEIWNKGKEGQKMSKTDLQLLLHPRVKKGAGRFRWTSIWVFMLLPLGAFGFGCANLIGYSSNPTMMVIIAGMLVASIGIICYGVNLTLTHSRIQRLDLDLVTILRRQLHFYRTKYEIWLWMIAASLVMATLNLNAFVDNQGGYYPVNKPAIFITVTIAQFFFGYVVMKLTQYPLLRETNAILSDLERQVTEATEKYDTFVKTKMKRWSIVLLIICTIALILGIIKASGIPG